MGWTSYRVLLRNDTLVLTCQYWNVNDVDHARLREVHPNLEQALKFDDSRAYHRQSREFHMALSRPSGMVRLVHMLESAWNITEPVQLMVHVEHPQRAVLHEDHRHMLTAFLAGTPTSCCRPA